MNRTIRDAGENDRPMGDGPRRRRLPPVAVADYGLRQAARFIRRNVRDIAEGLYDLTEAIATGTGSNHSARVNRTIGELESRLADLRRERERIKAKRKEAMANIRIASAARAELGCSR